MTEIPHPAEHGPHWRTFQVIAGLFNAAMGIFLFWLFWWLGTRERMMAPGIPFLASGMVIMGLGVAAFGNYKEERRRRGESLEGRSELQLLTPRWWALVVLWLASGVVYAVVWRVWIMP
jgi:hypothetical protein